jgi:hypothetical protein
MPLARTRAKKGPGRPIASACVQGESGSGRGRERPLGQSRPIARYSERAAATTPGEHSGQVAAPTEAFLGSIRLDAITLGVGRAITSLAQSATGVSYLKWRKWRMWRNTAKLQKEVAQRAGEVAGDITLLIDAILNVATCPCALRITG